MRIMLRSKIHRATVTGADLHYEGSATIDTELLESADILPYKEVDFWNITNGERFRTYAMPGQRGSGVLCINGAAAHKAHTGDLVIIASFGVMTEAEARDCKPRLVFVDARNRPLDSRQERAGQAEVADAWAGPRGRARSAAARRAPA